MKKTYAFLGLALLFFCHDAFLPAQEALKSVEEEYYDFLSLQGIVEKPALNYRTLSDSVWNFAECELAGQGEYMDSSDYGRNGGESATEERDIMSTAEKNGAAKTAQKAVHPWQDNNLGTTFTLLNTGSPDTNWYLKGIKRSITARIYGPQWFNSFNTAAPYGQNDGALWQGRGYNTSLTAGARLEGYGLELTFKPQVSFSQNLEFAYIAPNSNYSSKDKNGNPTIYDGKASKYGYYGVSSIDAPQRFGDSSFFTFDWGDTEFRYSWRSFTVGFGTQTIWLGPAQINPIIHSNNAPSYPKFDIGFRKTPLYFPYFNWYLGDIEARGWWGKLSESDFFDNDDSNNNNLIAGLSFAWRLPFTNLTFGLNRTMLSKWNEMSPYTLFHIYLPFDTSGGGDASDQRFSATADWIFEKVGLELYLEWGRNDFSPDLDYIVRYPFHTQGWTAGIKKDSSFTDRVKGMLLLEFTNLECSMDYDRLIGWYSTFYAHHLVTQGYTNKGQWLGASMTGGNSQYIGYTLYSPKWKLNFSFQRINPDLDFTAYIDTRLHPMNKEEGLWPAEANIRVQLISSVEFSYFFTTNFLLYSGFSFMDDRNYLNVSNVDRSSTHRYNCSIRLGLSYKF